MATARLSVQLDKSWGQRQTEYIFVIGLGALTVGLLGWWFNKLREEKEQSEQRQAEYEKRRLSDDEVMAAQRKFEKRLDENVDLPDGIRWKTAFIYRHLMRKWFSVLMVSNRYDEKSADKIKSDWLDYMNFLEERETSFFLAEWGKDKRKREAYEQEEFFYKSKIELIETTFATAVGKEAIEQLEHVRSSPHDAFDRSGRKPMAPVGYRYLR